MDLIKISRRIAVPMEQTNLDAESDASFKRLFANFGPKVTYYKAPAFKLGVDKPLSLEELKYEIYHYAHASDLDHEASLEFVKKIFEDYVRSGVYKKDAINFFVKAQESDSYNISAKWFAHDVGHEVYTSAITHGLESAEYDLMYVIIENVDIEFLNEDPNNDKGELISAMKYVFLSNVAFGWIDIDQPEGAAFELNRSKGHLFDLFFDYAIEYIKKNQKMPKNVSVNPETFYYKHERPFFTTYQDPKSIAKIIPKKSAKAAVQASVNEFLSIYENAFNQYFSDNIGKIVII